MITPAPFLHNCFFLFAGGLLLVTNTPLTGATEISPESVNEAWAHTQRYQFTQAQQGFASELERASASASRELRLGACVAMLNHPTLKTKDREASLDELAKLWGSRGEAPDQVGLWAGYLLGRWSQNYGASPDFDLANQWFELTASAGGDHPVAQLARLKSAGLWLYAPLSSNPSPVTRLSAARACGTQITDRGLRTSYLLLLVDGMLLHQVDHHQVLARLQELWSLDITAPKPRAKTLCQLGTISALAGDEEQAVRYYQQFVQEFPVDIRTQLVRDRLMELTSSKGSQP